MRDPHERYLSEWLNVAGGATWRASFPSCRATLQGRRNLSMCHRGMDDWSGVSLDDFMACPYNPASNRQTWMLADLEAIGCDRFKKESKETIDQLLLKSAMRNLDDMAYFGLTELRDEVSAGLKDVFGLDYPSEGALERTHAVNVEHKITTDQKSKLCRLNNLDFQLYNYAKKLYFQKFHKTIDDSFQ